MLDEVDAQHALQANGRTPIVGLGVVRCDFLAQRRPGHQRIHSLEEFAAPRRLTVLFKAQLRVGCHSKGLLLHGPVIYPGWSSSGDFFSIALNPTTVDLNQHCLSFEIGIHNSTLAIFIALSVLDNFQLALPATIYSVSMYLMATLFGTLVLRRKGVAGTVAA